MGSGKERSGIAGLSIGNNELTNPLNMSATKELSGRLREVFLNGQWIANTNYRDQLLTINRELAMHKVGILHTIAELVYHINYYLRGLLNVFRGGRLEISDKYSFDLGPVDTDAAWKEMVNEFLENAEAFALQVEQIPDGQLDLPFVDPKYGSCRRNIEAVIEHSYYHLGQIVIIKKMLLEWEI
jgi:hypothetical protein